MYRALFQAQHCLKGQRPGPEPSLLKTMETSTGAYSFHCCTPQINLRIGSTVTAESSPMYTYSITLNI
jgi:hypothetical protein